MALINILARNYVHYSYVEISLPGGWVFVWFLILVFCAAVYFILIASIVFLSSFERSESHQGVAEGHSRRDA